jgi:hypothetical protein
MRHAIAASAALLLAACGGQDGGNGQANDGNATAPGGGGSAAGGGNVAMQPGEWETTTQVLSMNVPNMPQGATPPTPPPTTVRSCLTQDQAAQPSADFITGSGENGGCTSENFSMANGRMQGTVQCSAEGASMRSTVDGSFTPTSYDVRQQVQTSAQGISMTMESRTTGRRLGDCPAG